MTPITLPRAVVQQVRDALKGLLEETERLHEAYNHERTQDAWDAEPEDDSLPLARAAIATLDAALAQPAPTPKLPPLPDERAAFEAHWFEVWGEPPRRFGESYKGGIAAVAWDTWQARAALAQRSAETSEVRALREENARLRGDCVEWLCARCQTIHPSQRGRTFLQPCPECGEAMEPTSFNIRALKRMDAIIEAARAALEALELHAKQYPHMQKGYTVDAIDALSAALANRPKEGGQR